MKIRLIDMRSELIDVVEDLDDLIDYLEECLTSKKVTEVVVIVR